MQNMLVVFTLLCLFHIFDYRPSWLVSGEWTILRGAILFPKAHNNSQKHIFIYKQLVPSVFTIKTFIHSWMYFRLYFSFCFTLRNTSYQDRSWSFSNYSTRLIVLHCLEEMDVFRCFHMWGASEPTGWRGQSKWSEEFVHQKLDQ